MVLGRGVGIINNYIIFRKFWVCNFFNSGWKWEVTFKIIVLNFNLNLEFDTSPCVKNIYNIFLKFRYKIKQTNKKNGKRVFVMF